MIIDTAPLTVVTGAAVLGTKADGVLPIARANATGKGALTYSAEQLRNGHCAPPLIWAEPRVAPIQPFQRPAFGI
ncbi:MAG: hypothetical protein Q8N53_12900 [Longimicrobiales bacterium]|nr:hypothetical protein [Longimicrobiales bacterium]